MTYNTNGTLGTPGYYPPGGFYGFAVNAANLDSDVQDDVVWHAIWDIQVSGGQNQKVFADLDNDGDTDVMCACDRRREIVF